LTLKKTSRITPSSFNILWGFSSVGRALAWHARGQGFDSPNLHHIRFSRKRGAGKTSLATNLLMSKFLLLLLACLCAYYYVFFIDAPERWVSPGTVTLSDEGLQLSVTNVTDQTVTLHTRGIAWEIATQQNHMILFEDPPRVIAPHATFTELQPLSALGRNMRKISESKKHHLILDIRVNGKRKRGFTKFSRLPVQFYDENAAE
jgi:hypothetical protein